MSRSILALSSVGALSVCLASHAGFSFMMTEIRMDETGADNNEYFEIYGAANASLDGYSLIVIGDGTPGSGTIESITSLNGYTTGSNGVFLATESTFSLSADPLASVGVFGTSGLNFENSDNLTFMLVQGFTGALNSDVDSNNDGVMDATFWDSVADSVALYVGPASEFVYSNTVLGPDGTFVPGHVYRDGYGDWQIGGFALGTNDTPGSFSLIPAPGALALVGVAGLVSRRRR